MLSHKSIFSICLGTGFDTGFFVGGGGGVDISLIAYSDDFYPARACTSRSYVIWLVSINIYILCVYDPKKV